MVWPTLIFPTGLIYSRAGTMNSVAAGLYTLADSSLNLRFPLIITHHPLRFCRGMRSRIAAATMHPLRDFYSRVWCEWSVRTDGVMGKWEEMFGVQQCPSALGGGAEVKVLR